MDSGCRYKREGLSPRMMQRRSGGGGDGWMDGWMVTLVDFSCSQSTHIHIPPPNQNGLCRRARRKESKGDKMMTTATCLHNAAAVLVLGFSGPMHAPICTCSPARQGASQRWPCSQGGHHPLPPLEPLTAGNYVWLVGGRQTRGNGVAAHFGHQSFPTLFHATLSAPQRR